MTDEAEEKEEELFPEEETPEIKTEVEKEPEKEPEQDEEIPAEPEPEKEPEKEGEPKSVPIAALHDKRRQVDQLKQRVKELEGQVPKSEPNEPDMYEDAEGWKEWNRNNVIAEQATARQAQAKEYLDKSRSVALEKHADYDGMEQVFGLMTLDDSTLIQKMLNSEDPAIFAYNKAKEYKAGLLSKDETPKTPSEEEKRNKTAVDTPSLATATAQASNLPQVEKEEKGLDGMFDDMKY